MPRRSRKQRVLRKLRELATEYTWRGLLQNTTGDDDTLEEVVGVLINAATNQVESRRYLNCPKYRMGGSFDIFERDLSSNETGEQLPWLSEDEFLQKYRMHRSSFQQLLTLIQDHPVFECKNQLKRQQAPVAHQLLLFLFYIGRAGSGANNPVLRQVFQIGRGTAELYKFRCITAIQSLWSTTIHWPTEEEQKAISDWIHSKFRIPNCIAIADGTLLFLTYEPELDDVPDYSG